MGELVEGPVEAVSCESSPEQGLPCEVPEWGNPSNGSKGPRMGELVEGSAEFLNKAYRLQAIQTNQD
jgi:hypothetical protein